MPGKIPSSKRRVAPSEPLGSPAPRSSMQTGTVDPSTQPKDPRTEQDGNDAHFEGLTVPRPLSVAYQRWADFGEEEEKPLEEMPRGLVEAPAPTADARPHSEEPETASEGDGSDWTPPTTRFRQDRFPDSPPQKPSPVGPTSIDAAAAEGTVVQEPGASQLQPSQRPRPPAKHTLRRAGPGNRPAVPAHTGGVVCTDAVHEKPTAPQPPPVLRRYDPYATASPPVSWIPTAHACNLDGRLAYRPYHPGALRDELPFLHTHDGSSAMRDYERATAPTSRLFVGHWWSEARTCVFQWMLDEFVTTPGALAITGHCVAYEPQLHFRSGTGEFCGCMHVRLCCAQPILVVRALHHRLLFDHAGVWYAETPEQLLVLREYSRWMGSLPRWKRTELLQGLPGTPLAVEFAANP